MFSQLRKRDKYRLEMFWITKRSSTVLICGMILALGSASCSVINNCGNYNLTPGTQLTFKEVKREGSGARTMVEYELHATGVPAGMTFTQKSPSAPGAFPSYKVDASGNLGGKVTTATFAAGEPLILVLVSEDQRTTICGTVTPRPFF